MRRHIVLLFVLLLILAAPAWAQTTLTLLTGERIDVAGEVTFAAGVFTLPDGRAFPRAQVKEVLFQTESVMERTSWTYDPDRYARLFAKGRELAAQYPDRAGVVLEDLGEYRLNDDGSNSFTYHFTALILKEKAKGWGRVGVGLQPGRHEVDGPHGLVVHPDGSFVVAGDAARTVTNPYQGTQFFSQYLVKNLTIPDVRLGDIVEFWYTLTETQPADPDFFFPDFMFQDTSPVALSQMIVRLPAGKELHYQALRMPEGAARPQRTDDGRGGALYRWALTDVPPLETEPAMPIQWEVVPTVRATVLADWSKIFDHLSAFYRSRIVVTEPVRQTTLEVVGDASDVHEKIARIYRFVQRKIRYISIKTDFGSGMTGHAAEVTLANGYGDCTDKSILMAAMLQVIGVQAHPIFLQTWGGRRDQYDVPNLGGDHSINRLFVDGRELFLDATASTYRYPAFRYDDQGMPYVDPLGRTVGRIARMPAADNLTTQEWDVALDEQGGARIRKLEKMTGVGEAMMRAFLEGFDERERQKQLQSQVAVYGPGARLESFADRNLADPDLPLWSEMTFTMPVLTKRSGNVHVVDLLELPNHFGNLDSETRRFDLLTTPFLAGVEKIYRVTLPPGWRVVDLPPAKTIDTPLVGFRGAYLRTAAGFALEFRLEFRAASVSPAQYPSYRQSLVEIEAFLTQRAFVEEVSR